MGEIKKIMTYRQKVLTVLPKAELVFYTCGHHENVGFGSGVDGYRIIDGVKKIGIGLTPYSAWKSAWKNLKILNP